MRVDEKVLKVLSRTVSLCKSFLYTLALPTPQSPETWHHSWQVIPLGRTSSMIGKLKVELIKKKKVGLLISL